MTRRRRVIETAESNELHRQRSHRMRWHSEHRFLHNRGLLPAEEGAVLEAAVVGRLVDRMGPDPVTGLFHRDRGCRFPDCHHRRLVHGYHVRFWSEGGPTDLCNLITLCPRHHRMLHEEGWRIEGNPNSDVTWIKPDGRVFAARAGR